jgi:prepilin-type processing-associated H-X9-DG protein
MDGGIGQLILTAVFVVSLLLAFAGVVGAVSKRKNRRWPVKWGVLTLLALAGAAIWTNLYLSRTSQRQARQASSARLHMECCKRLLGQAARTGSTSVEDVIAEVAPPDHAPSHRPYVRVIPLGPDAPDEAAWLWIAPDKDRDLDGVILCRGGDIIEANAFTMLAEVVRGYLSCQQLADQPPAVGLDELAGEVSPTVSGFDRAKRWTLSALPWAGAALVVFAAIPFLVARRCRRAGFPVLPWWTRAVRSVGATAASAILLPLGYIMLLMASSKGSVEGLVVSIGMPIVLFAVASLNARILRPAPTPQTHAPTPYLAGWAIAGVVLAFLALGYWPPVEWNRPEELARTTVDMAHLKGLSRWLVIYREENNGRMPEDLSELCSLAPEVSAMMVSTWSGHQRAASRSPDGEQAPIDVSYILSPLSVLEQAPSRQAVLWIRPSLYPNGRGPVAFWDGHVKRMEPVEMLHTLADSYDRIIEAKRASSRPSQPPSENASPR